MSDEELPPGVLARLRIELTDEERVRLDDQAEVGKHDDDQEQGEG